MPKFRKKPVEIEARQVPVYGKFGQAPDEIEQYLTESIGLAEWCGGISHMMLADDEISPAEGIDVIGPHIVITTLEGPHAALPGDWIIQGVQGEFYPCKPDIFDATYEAVS
jgi:hypothetical protein